MSDPTEPTHPRRLVTIEVITKDDGTLFWKGENHMQGPIDLQGQVQSIGLGSVGVMMVLRFPVKGRLGPDILSPTGQRCEIDADQGAPLVAPVLELANDDDTAPLDEPPEASCSRCGMSLLLCACALTH